MLSKVSQHQIIDFVKNLAIMLKSGITIDESLGLLSSQAKSKVFSGIIKKIKKDIESGISLSAAFAKEKKIFGSVFIIFLKAGEASGTLEKNLFFLADWLERNNDLRKEINVATLYPKIVLAATIILGGGLSIFILPRLTVLFSQLDIELPIFTKILIGFSLFLEKFWFFVLLAIALIIIIFILLNRIKGIKRIFHWVYLRIPFIGDVLTDYQLALICQLFSILLKSGLSIIESFEIASEVPTNFLYQESISESKKIIAKGTTVSGAMNEYPDLFPKNMVSIITTGEKSGTLEDSFSYMAEFYSKQVYGKTKKLPIVIEPILLIFIGVILGFVAVSIIMPIYQITKGFGN